MGKKFVLSEEDGSAANGNPRATGAVDLQLTRTAATQVASGSNSTIIGGTGNTASGSIAIAGGTRTGATGTWALAIGYQCNASNTAAFAFGREASATGNSAIAIGNNNPIATADYTIGIGSTARASAQFSVALGGNTSSTMYNQFSTLGSGIGQASDFKSYSTASLLSGGTVILTLDGTGVTNYITTASLNEAYNVQTNWVAVVTAITGTATGISVGDVITSIDLLAYKRVAGVATVTPHTSAATKLMVTSPAQYSACAISFLAGGNQEMALTFTGPTFLGGGTLTMRIVAKSEVSSVAW